MGRVLRMLTISAVLAAASPLPALPGNPSPQAQQGEPRPLSADKGKGFADDLVNGIKTSYAKGIALATGDSPIAVDVPKGVPVEVDRDHNGIGVSVGGIGVDVGNGVGVDVGKGGHGVGVDAGKGGVGVNLGKANNKAGTKREISDVDAANIPYMHTGPVDTTHREDQPSNENRIQARDDDHHDDDWRGGRGWRGNRGGFRADRVRGGRGGGWGGRGGGWGGRGGGWGGRGGRGRGWNRIASVDEADFAGSQPSNSTISFNPPAANRGSGLTSTPNPSKPANSFGESDNGHSAPVDEAGEFNQSGLTDSITQPDTNSTPAPIGGTSPIIIPAPSNQTGSNDQQNGSTEESNGSTDQTNGSNDQSSDSDGSLIIDNGGDDHQDEGNDGSNKVKRDVIRCNGDDNDNRLSCFCDDRDNRRWRNTRNGNRVVLDRDHDLDRRDLERRDVDTNTLSRRHWGHRGGDNWGLANVGVDVDVDVDHDNWDDDWRPRRGGNNGGVAVGVGPGGAVGVVGGGDDW